MFSLAAFPADVPSGTLPVFDFTGSPLINVIQLVLTFILPLLVGLVTDRLTSKTVQMVLHGGLSFVSAFLTAWLATLIAGTGFDWINALANGLITWIFGIVLYLGLWRPTGAAAALQNSTALQLIGPAKTPKHLEAAPVPAAAPANQPTPPTTGV